VTTDAISETLPVPLITKWFLSNCKGNN